MKKKRITVASAKAKGRNLQKLVCQKISDLVNLPWGKDETIASREMGQAGTDVRLIGEARKKFPFSVECFGKDTLVVTNYGLVPIQSIKTGDKVLTHLGRFRKVTNISKRLTKQVLQLHSTNNSSPIIVTPGHPFEGFYGEWVKAKEIKIFSHIIHSKNAYQIAKTKLALPERTHGNQNELPKSINIDKDFMNFIGWCIAEGCIQEYGIGICLSSEEKATAKRLSEYSQQTFGLKSSISFAKSTTKVNIISKLLSKFLMDLVGKGSRNQRIGEFLFYDKKLLASLLKSYFLGDGCIYDNGARCDTTSRILAYEIQFALLRFGIFSRVVVAKDREAPLYGVLLSRATLPIFMSLLGEENYRHEKACINSDDSFIYAPYKQRVFSDIKKSILVKKPTIVYNISVTEDESYVIEGGIVVHNCKAQESWSVPAWIRQAKENQLPKTDWLLIFKRKREKPVAVLDLDVFFDLLSQIDKIKVPTSKG